LTLDTDERIEFGGISNKRQLLRMLESDPKIMAWMVPAQDRTYSKERFLRIPTQLRWQGRTHEALVGIKNGERGVMTGCCFWETPKSPGEYQHKLERDLKILLDETAAQPLNPRWWYYLGQTYEGMRLHGQAIDAFDKCIRIDGWPEESSWAAYTAARCLVALEKYRGAEEYCALGMTRKPSVPELPWLAGWCCFKRGAWADAITWSKLAIELAQDKFDGNAATFRFIPAWYEGPYDVLRYAYRKINQLELANRAETDFEAAKAARLSATQCDLNHEFGQDSCL
jgi:tetratricopeptide (TPR) repeat protein